MKKTLSVDISKLEQCLGVDLHEFEPGETYPLSKLRDMIFPRSQKKKTSTEKLGQRGDMKEWALDI